jgi:hypothetical protein
LGNEQHLKQQGVFKNRKSVLPRTIPPRHERGFPESEIILQVKDWPVKVFQLSVQSQSEIYFAKGASKLSDMFFKRLILLSLIFSVFLTPRPTLMGQSVKGAYPIFPPAGPLQGKPVEQQVRFLKSMGFTLVGGRFRDGTIPKQLRAAGFKTLGMVVLWQGEEHWKSHPESRPILADGNPMPKFKEYAGVCPNQEWLQKQKLEEIKGMLSSGYYDVITLDFMRYPIHWEVPEPNIPDTCYCPACLGKFQKETGVRIPKELKRVTDQSAWILKNHADQWYRWRADQITAFCTKVSGLRDHSSPKTLISLAAVPWQPSDYDDAIYKVVGQDFRALAKVIEVFSPMSYSVLNGRPVQWIGEVNAYFIRETGRQVCPLILIDPLTKLPASTWKEIYRQAFSQGADGFIVSPFPNMTGSDAYNVFWDMFGHR